MVTVNGREMFDISEKLHPIQEEEFIKIERIKGKILLIGAEDDVLWDTTKYIRRMEKRLSTKEHSCIVENCIYEHATHFVFPEGMMKTILPVGGSLLVKVFATGRKYPKECKAARIDIDKRVTNAIVQWKNLPATVFCKNAEIDNANQVQKHFGLWVETGIP